MPDRRTAILALLLASGCGIDRRGLAPGPDDAIPPEECPAGRVDADGDPDNGCEYACVPTSPSEELCDGLDNDCDPSTEDGSGDPSIGEPCDGPDDDLCEEGTAVCVGGRWVCDDPTDNAHETCNAMDDDCDGAVDEDAIDATEWYPDGDGDGFGIAAGSVTACEAPEGTWAAAAGDCDDASPAVHPDATETCNGVDDDCNGSIDDGEGCDCIGETDGGSLYWFCRSAAQWTDARDRCGERGAQLVTIETMGEQDWIVSRVRFHRRGPWWIGLNDRDVEGEWVWVDGTPATFFAWNEGEPNDGDWWLGAEDCVETNAPPDGRWNDRNCADTRPYVCEASDP